MNFGDPIEITDTVEYKLPRGTYVLPTDDDELAQSFLQKSVINLRKIRTPVALKHDWTDKKLVEIKSFSSPGYAVLFILVAALVVAVIVALAIWLWKSRKYRTSVTFIDSPRDSMPEDPEDPRDCIVTKGMGLFRRSADTEATNNTSTVSGNTSSWRRFVFCCNKPHKVSYESMQDRNLSGGTSAEASDHHEWEIGNDHPTTLVYNKDEINDPVDMPFVDSNTVPEHNGAPQNADSQKMENTDDQPKVNTPAKFEPREFSTPKLIKDAELNNGISIDKVDVEKKQDIRLANPLCDDRASNTSSCRDDSHNDGGSNSSEEQASVSANDSPGSASFSNDDKCLRVRFDEE